MTSSIPWLVIVVLQQSIAPGPACPHLSGTYIVPSEDGLVSVVIHQQQCERITIAWKTESDAVATPHTLAIDGKLHPDKPWWDPGPTILSSAQFRGQSLYLLSFARNQVDKTRPIQTWVFTLAANGDLCARLTNSYDSGHYATLAVRATKGRKQSDFEEGDPQYRCNPRPK